MPRLHMRERITRFLMLHEFITDQRPGDEAMKHEADVHRFATTGGEDASIVPITDRLWTSANT